MAPRGKEPTVFCSECRIHYPNYMSYDAHRKRKMKAGEGHIHCETCSAEFTHMDTLIRHQKQEHPREQDLNCPGCHLHFTRLGGLMNHIESNQCLKIPKREIEEERLKRSYMSKELAKAGRHDPKEFFGRFPGMGSITAMDQRQHYLGYIESGGPKDLALSATGPVGKVPESSNLSIKTSTSRAQTSRHEGLRSGSLDTTDFPTPAEAAISKYRIGGENKGASAKENASNVPSPAHDIVNATVQHVSGPDQRSGDSNVKGLLTIAEVSVHKGSSEPECQGGTSTASHCSENGEEILLSKAKSLNDSRWAPNKLMTASPLSRQSQSRHVELHPIYDKDILNKRVERDQTKGPGLSQETKQPAIGSARQDAEQADTVANKGGSIRTQGPSLRAGESSAGPIGQSEVTSHFSAASEDTTGGSSRALPPHLRAKFLRQEATVSSKASICNRDDQSVRMLPPHLQSGLDADLTTAAKTETLDGENDASTIKHSDQGTMGLLPTSYRGGRSASALPPHLRIKINDELKDTEGGGIESESSDGGVRLERREKGKFHPATSTEANTAQLVPELSMLTGRSTIGGADSRNDVERIQPSRSGETLANTSGSSGLPPHLRVKPDFVVTASPTRPAETGDSPPLNLSTGQSTPEPVGSEREPGMSQAPTSHDNFGVVQSVKSYSVVTKGDRAIAPHLRAKQAPDGASPTDQINTKDAATDVALKLPHSGSRDATTQTGDVTTIAGGITLRPTDTSMEGVSPMDPEEEDVGLGPHDPQHPMFDARNYRSPYTGRFHCPIPNCGKGFKSMQGIIGHLASDVHRRPFMRLQCPHCLRYFNSVTALTQHSESEGRKCEIRNTNEFRHFLDHLTAGLADVEGKHEDQTNKYIVPEIAQTKYGGDEVERRMRNALEQEEARQREEKGGGFHDGKAIHW